MALQRAHAISISRRAVIAKEGSFRVKILLGLPLLSLVDIHHFFGGCFFHLIDIRATKTNSVYCLQFYIRLGPESPLDER
jgi:hypothetical protein